MVAAIRGQFKPGDRIPPAKYIIQTCENAGELEKGFLKLSTYYRVAKKLGLDCNKRVHQRVEAEYANQVHVMDFSGSEYFGVLMEAVEEKDGEYLIRLKEMGESGTYKNKMTDKNVRVWVGSIVDKYSRVLYMWFFVAPGEGVDITAKFLEAAWKKKPDNHLYGLPENLQMDNSSFSKFRGSKNMFSELGIAPKPHKPKNPDAKGAVEVRFKNLWRNFEGIIRIQKQKEFTLTQINQMLTNFVNNTNIDEHPIVSGKSREQIYLESLAGQTIRKCPDNFSQYIFFEDKRTPDGCGIITINKKLYQIANCDPTMLYKTIKIYKNIDGELVAQNPRTKEFHKIEPYKPNLWGTFKGVRLTPQEKLQKEIEIPEFKIEQLPFGTPRQRQKDNITYLSRINENIEPIPFTAVNNKVFTEDDKIRVFTANVSALLEEPFEIYEIPDTQDRQDILDILNLKNTKEDIEEFAYRWLLAYQQTYAVG